MATEVNTRVTQRPVNKTVRFHVLTLSPRMFSSPFKEGVISRAVTNGLIKIETYDMQLICKELVQPYERGLGT